MKKALNVALLPRLLDCQIIDKDGYRCGKVDDLELTGNIGKEVAIKAILVGPRAWYNRRQGFLQWIVAHIFCDRNVARVPWEDVEAVFPLIKLTKTAEQAGLAKYSDMLKKYIERIPGS